jgi:hypothetical protein
LKHVTVLVDCGAAVLLPGVCQQGSLAATADGGDLSRLHKSPKHQAGTHGGGSSSSVTRGGYGGNQHPHACETRGGTATGELVCVVALCCAWCWALKRASHSGSQQEPSCETHRRSCPLGAQHECRGGCSATLLQSCWMFCYPAAVLLSTAHIYNASAHVLCAQHTVC